MGADDTYMSELTGESAKLRHFCKFEVDNDNVGNIPVYVMANFVDVPCDNHILEVRMKTCSEVLGNDAI